MLRAVVCGAATVLVGALAFFVPIDRSILEQGGIGARDRSSTSETISKMRPPDSERSPPPATSPGP